MLCSYFGQHRPRLELMIAEVQKAVAQNRKVLFLSYSIDELVNLLAIWNKATQLYTDVPAPTHEELGEKIPPVALDIPTRKRLMRKMMEHREYIKANPKLEYNQKRALELQIADYKYRIQQDDVANKVRLEHEKRQRSYVQEMLKLPSTAGLMIGAIKPKERQRMLKEKQVTFAIMKYGREGLDEPSLDTVFVAEPMSQKNALQQLMGRVLRKKDGKKKPIVMFFEDDVGPMIGMCTNLRRHLRTWPLEEGGPFEYVLLGHPRKGKGHAQWT
jgi:superfamily II DNA or RNA helicase